MSIEKPYEPTQKELEKAENMMTDEQRVMSRFREEPFQPGNHSFAGIPLPALSDNLAERLRKLYGKDPKEVNRLIEENSNNRKMAAIALAEKGYWNLDASILNNITNVYASEYGTLTIWTNEGDYIVRPDNTVFLQKTIGSGVVQNTPLSEEETANFFSHYKPHILVRIWREAAESVDLG